MSSRCRHCDDRNGKGFSVMAYKPVARVGGWGSARPQRQFQILTVLFDEYYDRAGDRGAGHDKLIGWLTTGEIARRCRLKPSPHFRGILDELLGRGVIFVEARPYRANMSVYVWRISENARWSEDWKAAFDAWLDPEQVLA